jgi:hypothetical protein
LAKRCQSNLDVIGSGLLANQIILFVVRNLSSLRSELWRRDHKPTEPSPDPRLIPSQSGLQLARRRFMSFCSLPQKEPMTEFLGCEPIDTGPQIDRARSVPDGQANVDAKNILAVFRSC